jgi:hypothetical protein
VTKFQYAYGWAFLALSSTMMVVPAAAETVGFQAPSGNIHCMYFDDEGGASLRCDIGETTNTPPEAPADCELDWGYAFAMDANSQRAERICAGDAVSDPSLPKLGYGESWEQGGFTCTSEKTGLSCRNERGAGWDLSRAAQKLY